MHAAIFDIDGTLLESCAVDSDLFTQSILHVMGDVRIRDAWEHYTHVTDTGILNAICGDNSLTYDDDLSDSIMQVFLDRLSGHMQVHGPFREMPGALDYLQALRQRSDVRVAYATGGWRASARLKLSSAGFPVDGIPLATANDHQERCGIMLHALNQLEGPFDSITYYGDGVWDRKATATLGWRFVAVGDKLGGISHFGSLGTQP